MDKLSFQNQIEHEQSKYVGTGNPDTTKHEWLRNQYRDSISSFIGHSNILSYISIAQNESISRKMIQPCGPIPSKEKTFK